MNYSLVLPIKRLRLRNNSREDSVGVGESFVVVLFFLFRLLFLVEGAVDTLILGTP
jgi:hypothetical protein